MNVLSNRIGSLEIKIFERIHKKFNIENLYVIMSEKYIDGLYKSSLSSLIKECFLWHECFEANYDKYIFYDQITPLDEEILDKMSMYEAEEFKILERKAENRELINATENRFIQYHKHVRYWNYFLDKAKIDYFFPDITPHDPCSYVIMRLCQIKHIPVIQFETLPCITTNRIYAYLDFESFDQSIMDRIEQYKIKYNRAEDVILPEDLQKEYSQFMNQAKSIVPVGVSKRGEFEARVKYAKFLLKQYRRRLLKETVASIKRQNRTKKMLAYYEKKTTKPNYNEPYIYFPLHLQPEITTSPRGGWFVHQYLAIEMLSYFVPEGTYIYVKEHPAMRSLPSNSRIKEHYFIIEKLNNVKLISIDISSDILTENCVAVASITGNVGYEGMYKKKPFLMFGNQVMKYGPGTFNIRNNQDCKRAVDKIFGSDRLFDDIDIKIYLKVMGEITERLHAEGRNPIDTEENAEAYFTLYKQFLG